MLENRGETSIKYLAILTLLLASAALHAEPGQIEVGLDARLEAAGMELEVPEPTVEVDEDRLASPPAHERVLRFENVRVEYPEALAELAGAFGLWADQAQPKVVAAFAEMRVQVIEQVDAQQKDAQQKDAQQKEEAINERTT